MFESEDSDIEDTADVVRHKTKIVCFRKEINFFIHSTMWCLEEFRNNNVFFFFFNDYYSACRFITTNFHTSTWSHLVRFHDFTVLGWPFGLWVTPRLRLCFFFLVNCLDVLYERWGKIDPELRRLAGHLLHVSVFWWHILYKQQDNHSTTAWAVDMGFLDYKWVLLLR